MERGCKSYTGAVWRAPLECQVAVGNHGEVLSRPGAHARLLATLLRSEPSPVAASVGPPTLITYRMYIHAGIVS